MIFYFNLAYFSGCFSVRCIEMVNYLIFYQKDFIPKPNIIWSTLISKSKSKLTSNKSGTIIQILLTSANGILTLNLAKS